MRFRSGLLAVAVLLSSLRSAGADALFSGIHAGASLPTGTAAAGGGYHVGFSLDYEEDGNADIGLAAKYHVLGEQTTSTTVFIFPITVQGRPRILDVALSIRGVIGSKRAHVTPYIEAGIGLDHVTGDMTFRSSTSRTDLSVSDNVISEHAGAGVRFRLSDATYLRLGTQFHRTLYDEHPADLWTVAMSVHTKTGR